MRKPYNIFFCLSILIILAVVFLFPFHTQDGPNHKKDTLILSRLDSSPMEAKVYRSGLGLFNTNTFFSLLYMPFKKFLSIDVYEKCYIVFFLISLLIIFRLFLNTWSRVNTDLWPLFLPFLFHPLYLIGMYNFLASVSIALLALILVYRGMERKSWKYVLWFFLLCWLGQLAHPFTFIILSLVLGVQGFLSWKEDWKHFLPFVVIVVFFLLLGFMLPFFGSGMIVRTPYSFGVIPQLIGGLLVFNFMDYSVIHFILPLPFLIFLSVIAIKNVRTQGLRKNALWLAALLFYFLFPRLGGGSAHANERFLPFIFLFFPLTLGQFQSVWRNRIVVLSFVTFLMISGGVVWGMFQVQKEVKNAQVVLTYLPKISRLYPINFNLNGPSLINGDFYHTWADYENDRIVFSPYLFAFDKLTPLLRSISSRETYFPALDQEYPRRMLIDKCNSLWLDDTPHCELWREEATSNIIKDAQYYDYWLVHEAPKDFWHKLQEVPGLKLIAQSGSFSLWHYQAALPFNPPVP